MRPGTIGVCLLGTGAPLGDVGRRPGHVSDDRADMGRGPGSGPVAVRYSKHKFLVDIVEDLQGESRASRNFTDERSGLRTSVALDITQRNVLNRSIAGDLASNAVRNRRLVRVGVRKVAGYTRC